MPIPDSPSASGAQSGARNAGGSAGNGAAAKLAGQIRGQFGWLKDQGINKVTQLTGTGKDQLAAKLDDVAGIVSSIAGSAESQYGPAAAQYVRRAAEGVTSAAEGLRGQSVEELVSGSRSFIQNNPAVCLGTAAALGFAAARIAKGGIQDEGGEDRTSSQSAGSARVGEFA